MARCSSLGFSLFLLQVVAIFLVTGEIDYCSKSLCSGGNHIACNNTWEFLDSCPKGVKLVEMTPDLKDFIVKAHNTYRNKVASGDTKLDKACRMATMSWNDELAEYAELNVKQCKMKHDKCRNTKEFPHAGQCLATMKGAENSDHTTEMQKSVDMWFSEIEKVTMNDIKKLRYNAAGSIGHFTAVVWDRNTHVGCAAITYPAPKSKFNKLQNIIACNYAVSNLAGSPVYKSCPTAGSECTTGANPDFNSLCSLDEEIDVNKWG